MIIEKTTIRFNYAPETISELTMTSKNSLQTGYT